MEHRLIIDEVMTGFGRTGKTFTMEHESVIPAMAIMAKGLTGDHIPLAITLISEKLFSVLCRSAVPWLSDQTAGDCRRSHAVLVRYS